MTEEELMLTSVLNCRRTDLYTKDFHLSNDQQEKLQHMKSRRLSGEPLQVILGQAEFCGMTFFVNEHTLVPRPETELMVDAMIKMIKQQPRKSYDVLDIGIGSGCIAIALAKQFSFLKCHGIDVSLKALHVAHDNVCYHDAAKQVQLIHGDIFQWWPHAFGPLYDIIISNPPYIPTAQLTALPLDVQAEPRISLDGGEDGLRFYRNIITNAPAVLKPNGVLVCEFWDGQDVALKKLFDEKWHVAFYKDLSGVNRFFKAQYLS